MRWAQLLYCIIARFVNQGIISLHYIHIRYQYISPPGGSILCTPRLTITLVFLIPHKILLKSLKNVKICKYNLTHRLIRSVSNARPPLLCRTARRPRPSRPSCWRSSSRGPRTGQSISTINRERLRDLTSSLFRTAACWPCWTASWARRRPTSSSRRRCGTSPTTSATSTPPSTRYVAHFVTRLTGFMAINS